MIFQVHTDPLSFLLALLQNELKNYSEGELLNQRNVMKLLPLIPQITIQTLYPSFKPKCYSVKIYYKQEYHV